MSVVLLVLTDGRDELLAQTITSVEKKVHGDITRRIIHVDTNDEHRASVARFYPSFRVIGGERLGFGGAIDRAWKYVAEGSEDFVFSTEDDFTFNRHVDLDAMAEALTEFPHISQMALRRQPWNDAERAAGGIVEQWPTEYLERDWEGHRWLEHQLFWTTNPSLFRVGRCAGGWPVVPQSERSYSEQVFSDPDAVSAFWGSRDSGEAVRHIGEQRVGTKY